MKTIHDIITEYFNNPENVQKCMNRVQDKMDSDANRYFPSVDKHIKMNINFYKNTPEYHNDTKVKEYVDYIELIDIDKL